MTLNATIGLSGQDHVKCSFKMPVKATHLNKHGGAIQLNRDLSVGSTILVQNKLGVQVSARVVRQVSRVEEVRTYGIEFLDQDDQVKSFWGITFPTA